MPLGSSYVPGMIAALKAAGGTVSMTVSGVAGDVLVDFDDASFAGDGAGPSGANRAVVVPAGLFPALVPGVAVTLDGSAYKARSVVPLDDGALLRVEVSR